MSGQRVHAGEQVVLTGSAFHIPRKQIIEALWVILPRHSRYPQIVKYLAIRAALATFARKAGQAGMFPFKSCACLARPACLAQISRTTTKEGAADVEALGGQRERIPHRNMGAKLPNYIWQVFECKADAPFIRARGCAQAGGARRARRGRVRGPKCEVFRISNPELRTSSRAFPASLTRLA